jgi:hypothetical protein
MNATMRGAIKFKTRDGAVQYARFTRGYGWVVFNAKREPQFRIGRARP